MIGAKESEAQEVAVADLIMVAEFRNYIYPDLASTGKDEHGGDKPNHTVINDENFHALEALTSGTEATGHALTDGSLSCVFHIYKVDCIV